MGIISEGGPVTGSVRTPGRPRHFILMLGIVLGAISLELLSPSIRSLYWREAIAKITSSKTQKSLQHWLHQQPSPETTFVLEYTYLVEGHNYFGGGAYSNYPETIGIKSDPSSIFVRILYNPRRPEQSILKPHVSIVGVFFAAIALGCVAGPLIYVARKRT